MRLRDELKIAIPLFIVVIGFIVVNTRQPFYGNGLVVVIACGVVVFALPQQKVIGYLGAAALVMLTCFPIIWVTKLERFGQLAVLAVFLVATVVLRRAAPGVRWAIPLLLGAYFVVTIASTSRAHVTGAWFDFTIHAVIGLVMFTVGLKATAAERRLLTRTVFVIAAVQSVYAVIEVVARPPVLWASPVPTNSRSVSDRLPSEIIPGLDRAQGTFAHPLLLAMFLAVALGLAATYTFENPRTRVVLSGLLLVGGLATGSRSTMVVMLLILLFVYVKSTAAKLIGGVAAAGFLIASLGFASSLAGSVLSGGSVSHRQGALEAIPRLLTLPEVNVLIGNGWFSRQSLFDKHLLQLDGFFAIDNQFVSLLVTAGIAGVLIFVGIVVFAFMQAGALRPALFAAFAMYLVFDVNEYAAPWGVLMLLLGLIAANARTATPESPEFVMSRERRVAPSPA